LLALFCATGFVLTHYSPTLFERREQVETPTHPVLTLPIAGTKDVLWHLDNALAAQKETSAALWRAQDWTDRALSSLDDPALTARRLQLARSASRFAEAQSDRAQRELEIANDILTERSNNETANNRKR